MVAKKLGDNETQEIKEISPSSDSVLNKYVTAGEIANKIMKKLIEKCVDGASCRSICIIGDEMILEETGKIFKKNKSIKKGIAFPTCVSLNDCICHFSPLLSDDDMIMKTGDMVKIDFSVYISGFIAGIAHTLVVGASNENPVTGIKADILKAAYIAEEAILRTIKVDKTNMDVKNIFNKVVNEFKCYGVEDMVCFRISHNNMEDEKKIIMVPGENYGKDYKEEKFELYEVYCIDVFVTNSELNKPKSKDTRTTIFKQTDSSYNLKLKASKELKTQINQKSLNFGFNLRSMDNESKARMGIKECIEHGVVIPYPVLYLKEGDYVAHFKFTIIITPNGILKITSHPWDDKLVKSDKSINDESINKLLSEPYNKKKVSK